MRIRKDTVHDEDFYMGTERVHGILELLAVENYKILSVIYRAEKFNHMFVIFSQYKKQDAI